MFPTCGARRCWHVLTWRQHLSRGSSCTGCCMGIWAGICFQKYLGSAQPFSYLVSINCWIHLRTLGQWGWEQLGRSWSLPNFSLKPGENDSWRLVGFNFSQAGIPVWKVKYVHNSKKLENIGILKKQDNWNLWRLTQHNSEHYLPLTLHFLQETRFAIVTLRRAGCLLIFSTAQPALLWI